MDFITKIIDAFMFYDPTDSISSNTIPSHYAKSLQLPTTGAIKSLDYSVGAYATEELARQRRLIVSAQENLPIVKNTYMNWEYDIHVEWYLYKVNQFYYVAPLCVLLYLLSIYFGRKIMANRKPFDLSTTLKYWNLSLAIFSAIGTFRVWSQILYSLYYLGFTVVFTSPPLFTYGLDSTGFWIMLFTLSKFVELFDTVFIILRKKPLEFLHWYHHMTVLLYTWDGFCIQQPMGVLFVAINYAVHTMMYFYYYISAHRKGRKPSWAIFVTMLQIAQMGFGIFLTIVSLHFAFKYEYADHWTILDVVSGTRKKHFISTTNLFYGLLMYCTYLYLFGVYFASRYNKQPTKSKETHSSDMIEKNQIVNDTMQLKNKQQEKKMEEEQTAYQNPKEIKKQR